jgi:hypothetical protein
MKNTTASATSVNLSDRQIARLANHGLRWLIVTVMPDVEATLDEWLGIVIVTRGGAKVAVRVCNGHLSANSYGTVNRPGDALLCEEVIATSACL